MSVTGQGGEAASASPNAAALLDARGLACPLPVLKAKKAIRALAAGDVLEVLATDPGASADFEAFCEVTGHILLDRREADGVFTFLIRRKQ